MARQQKLAKPAKIIAVLGDTGTGKSAYVKQQLAEIRPARCVKWDFKREYQDGEIYTELKPLLDAIEASGRGPFSFIFRPVHDEKIIAKQFDIVCRAVWAARDICFLVEELRFVTSPQRSPYGWAMVSLTGRDQGLFVIGTSQRPSSIDKDFLGNATIVHTGCLGYEDDERAVAKAMRIHPDRIHALKELEWLEYSKKTKQVTPGKLSF